MPVTYLPPTKSATSRGFPSPCPRSLGGLCSLPFPNPGFQMSLRLVAVMCALAIPIEAASPQDPPVARQIPKVDTLHGEVRVDDYFWLREKTNPEVTACLEAENAYTTQQMKHTEALQDKLYQEMLGRIKENNLSLPGFVPGVWCYDATT